MTYITNYHHFQLTDMFLGLKNICVIRLSGEIHKYNIVLKNPCVHKNPNCQRLKKSYVKSGTIKPNSGSNIIINYPIKHLIDNTFEEIDDTVSEFRNSLYFHAGFNECQFCSFVNSLKYLNENDYVTSKEWGIQYNEDIAYLKKYFKDNPDELDSWLGLD
nr:hypothetical protein [Pseudopedobacter sp.]